MLRRKLLCMAPEDVPEGVLTFASAANASKELQDRLPYVRAWYAIRDSEGDWRFAPSKWAGYLHMDPEAYLGSERSSLDGRKTEKRLQQWYHPLDHEFHEYAELRNELAEFLAEYGKEPSAVARISVISNSTEAAKEDDDDLVELLVRVVRRLEPGQQARFKLALAGGGLRK